VSVPLQVVEPTLEDYSGHCHALVSSLARAAGGHRIDLWSGEGSAPMAFGPGVTVHAWFHRRHRQSQMLRLMHRLLRGPSPVVLTTARMRDLAVIALVAPGRLPAGHVFLYFHWLRVTPLKRRALRFIAARQPEIVILCTTERLLEVFLGCGFHHVALLQYPAPEPSRAEGPVQFRRLLYAGAARSDKGFGIVVDLVELLAARNADIPIAVQITPDHYAKYDGATREDIVRLEAIRYAPLTLIRETPSPAEYAANFAGSICLQPYDLAEFRDRVSGVTLDALAHGCPIVATAGTWTAALIAPFDAGIAVSDPDAESLHAAVAKLRADYPRYRNGALAAAYAREGEPWAPLLERLRS